MFTKNKVQIVYVPLDWAQNNEGVHVVDGSQADIDQAISRARGQGFDVVWVHSRHIIKVVTVNLGIKGLQDWYLVKGGKDEQLNLARISVRSRSVCRFRSNGFDSKRCDNNRSIISQERVNICVRTLK